MATETKNKPSTVQVCNGCGKNEDEVRKIVFMPNNIAVYNACIELMKSLIETDEDETLSTIDWLRRLGIKTKDKVILNKDGINFAFTSTQLSEVLTILMSITVAHTDLANTKRL